MNNGSDVTQSTLVLFIGIFAFLAGLYWGVGIRVAVKGNWAVLYSALILSGFLAMLVFVLGLGDALFPLVAPLTWIIVGLIFAATLLYNLFIGPWLSGSLDELTLNILNWAGCLLASAAMLLFGIWGRGLDLTARFAAVLIAVIILLYGVGLFLQWARDNI